MNSAIRRALVAGAGVAVAVTGSIFAISSPALADYPCGGQQVCFYQDKDGHGSPATLSDLRQGGYGVPNFAAHKFHNGVNVNDQVSSVHNNTNQYLAVWEDANYQGRVQVIDPYRWANFTGGSVRNDRASSARFVDEPCDVPNWCV